MKMCSGCTCYTCLNYWSQRCPYGGCWDEYRAKYDPWKGEERRSWTLWDQPGEQEHWCRGGVFYPVNECPYYELYDAEKTTVRTCLFGNVKVFQDGYIQCGLVDGVFGCELCYERFEEEQTRLSEKEEEEND